MMTKAKDTEKKNKGGRPSKYGTINLKQVTKLAELGLTDKQMAYALDITEETLNQYKKKEEFSESLKRGKAISDERVVRSLFERATGYSHPEDKLFCYEGQVVVEPTVKQYPPDTTACIFWLKNRKPKEWRDKMDHEHSTPDGIQVQVLERMQKLSPEERKKRIEELKAKAC